MTHLDEARLVAHLLEDDGLADRAAAAEHLRACADCRDALLELRRVLDVAAVDVPPRGPDYGAQVWARLEPRLARSRTTLGGRVWLAAAAAVLIAVSAFLVGRWSQPVAPAQPSVNAYDQQAVRERVVLAALGEHLERAERTLIEVANAEAGAHVEFAAEQAWARDLLQANRLYRQSARGTASPVVVDLLADLEPILLEIVNSPRRLPPDELRALQSRIERHGLVFKLRVTGAQVRHGQRTHPAGGAPTS